MRTPLFLATLVLVACPASPPSPPPTPTASATASPSPPAAPATPSPTTTTGTTTPATPTFALVVSFYSPGNGTDAAAFERLEKLLAAQPKKLARTTTRWGREGEHDECFLLTELTPAERTEFVAQVRKEMSSSQRVNIGENAECTPGR